MPILAERLKLLREEAGITQTQAGEIVKTQYKVYQKYEYGTANPPLEKLITFALYYKTSISYLIGNSDERNTKLTRISTFTERLPLLRKRTGLFQREVAAEIGVYERTYRKYELGEHTPNIETLCKLAAFYGVSVDYLVGLDVTE